jgi:hypothetical protein
LRSSVSTSPRYPGRLGLRAADCEVVRAERQPGKCRDGPDELALLDFIRLGDAVNSISVSSERTIMLDDDSPMTDGMARLQRYHP